MTKEELVSYIKQDYDDAIRLFGEYTMDDKGPRETMNMDAIEQNLRSMVKEKRINDVIWILNEILDYGDYTEDVVACMLSAVDDIDDKSWKEIFVSNPRFSEIY